ncbi:MAG: hypothetical protein ACRDXX_10155 [Stackebrandtia sp.]
MASAHDDTLPADDAQAIFAAVGRAAAGDVVRLVKDDKPIADLTPPDPDSAFRPMLAEMAARAAEICEAHPDPADLERWQRADRLHERWRNKGALPSVECYVAQLRKLGVLSEEQIVDQAESMVRADVEALIAYPLPAR